MPLSSLPETLAGPDLPLDNCLVIVLFLFVDSHQEWAKMGYDETNTSPYPIPLSDNLYVFAPVAR